MAAVKNTPIKAGRRRPVFIVDGSRTPFLKAKGPGPFSASDLAVAAARPLLLKQPFEVDAFDEVILGCVMPGPDEANVARVTALRLGLPHKTPAWTVQRNCASGMQAIDSAAHDIADGRAELVLAGGSESMSLAPVLLGRKMVEWLSHWQGARSMGSKAQTLLQLRPNFFVPIIALLRGLTDPVVGLSMGQTAEILAQRFNISREMMDAYALESHRRLARAQDENNLDEIQPIYDREGHCYTLDDGLRRESSLAQLGKLKPVFDRPFGLVTAGNSAQVTDGASWLILASEAAVEQHGLSVMARLVDSQWSGLDPAQMGLGPAHAMNEILKRKRLKPDDIDYWEINEAFAAQVLSCLEAWKDTQYSRQELGRSKAVGEIDLDRLNVDGGAVALGHPVGASGARIVLHLLKVMQREGAHRGMASLCIGGGQGGAMLFEREGG